MTANAHHSPVRKPMQPVGHSIPLALHGTSATRAIERAATAQRPPHALMERAGLAVARLSLALNPHARRIWVACGPGNNGGDGLLAATHLHQWGLARQTGLQVLVTHDADPQRMPADAMHALARARAEGVCFTQDLPDGADWVIDALLGIGARPDLEGPLAKRMQQLQDSQAPVLCVDLPSGLDADTGAMERACPASPRHTLSLLTLKPGLFTAGGRDAAGQVWFDDLGVTLPHGVPATAWLHGQPPQPTARPHAAHKGSFGDVVVLGGQQMSGHEAGMAGAAVLAGRAALHGGAGRVYVALLGDASACAGPGWDPACPELMFRPVGLVLDTGLAASASVVCGCGGGERVATVLPRLLSSAPSLVLDADALNAIARDTGLQRQLTQRASRGWTTVLTPHPLEAARLLGTGTATVMADRLGAAVQLSRRFGAICVLKGSGTIVCAPDQLPRINPTGNGALATAGTGDVLAGWIGAAIAAPGAGDTLARVASAVHHHGWLADQWAQQQPHTRLTAGRLALAG